MDPTARAGRWVGLLVALLYLAQLAYWGWIGYYPAVWDYYFSQAEKTLVEDRDPDHLRRAEAQYRKALDAAQLLVPSDGRLARTYHDLATVLWLEHRYDEAELMFKRSLLMFEQYDGPRSYFVGVVQARLGEISLAKGQFDQAREQLEHSLPLLQEAVGRLDSLYLRTRADLGLCHYYQGRNQLAMQCLQPILHDLETNAQVGDDFFKSQIMNAYNSLRLSSSQLMPPAPPTGPGP